MSTGKDVINDLFSMFQNNKEYTDLQNELNRLYWSDAEYYIYRINKIKSMGYKVLRNSEGIHKVYWRSN